MSNTKKLKKYLIFVVGLFFMGLGVALVTKSNLGTSSISSVPYVLSMIFPLTIGQFTFLLSLLFLLIQIIILRKDFPKEQFLQVLVGPLFGLFIDLGMFLFNFVNPNLYVEKIIALLLGCIILALGVYVQIYDNVIVNPGEGVVKTIANKMGKEFGKIKIIVDMTLVLIAIVISLFAFESVRGIGEGTIASAFLVGYIIRIYSYILNHFHNGKRLANEI